MKYYLANNGKPEGPYSVDELKKMCITPSTLVWNKELNGWTPAAEVPELDVYVLGGAQNPPSVPNGGYISNDAPKNTSYNNAPVCPKTWLVESILVTLFCCLPFGIVGIIKASQVESAFRSGDYDTAKRNSSEAGKWTKWGFFCGIGLYILYFIYICFTAFLGSSYL